MHPPTNQYARKLPEMGDVPEDYPTFPYPREGHPAWAEPDSKAKHEARLRWYEAFALANQQAFDDDEPRVGQRSNSVNVTWLCNRIEKVLRETTVHLRSVNDIAVEANLQPWQVKRGLVALRDSGRLAKLPRRGYVLTAQEARR